MAEKEESYDDIINREKDMMLKIAQEADQSSLRGMLLSTLLEALGKTEDPEIKSEIMDNISLLQKEGEVVVTKSDKKKLTPIFKKEIQNIKRDIAIIKSIKKSFKEMLGQLGRFVHYYKDSNKLFDETKDFFWKSVKDERNNVYKIREFKKGLETLNFDNYLSLMKKIQFVLSADEKLQEFFKTLSSIQFEKEKVLLGHEHEVSINKILYFTKTPRSYERILRNLAYVKYFNDEIKYIIELINMLHSQSPTIKSTLDEVVSRKITDINKINDHIRYVKDLKEIDEPRIDASDKTKFKALVLTHEFERGGGVAKVVSELSEEFGKQADIVADVIVRQPPGKLSPKSTAFTFYYKGKKQNKVNFKTANDLILFLSAFKYDIIHTHSLSFTSILKGGLTQIITLNPDAKVIYTCHSVVAHERYLQGRHKPWGTVDIEAQNELMEKADKITHLTNFGAKIAHGNWKEFEQVAEIKRGGYYKQYRSKACIIPNGIDLTYNFFYFDNMISAFNIHKKNRRVKLAYIGRLSEEKGVINLTKIFPQVAAKYPNLDLVIIGDEFPGTGIKSMMQHYLQGTSSDRYEFKGYLEGEALAREYTKIDLLIVPSINESFSIVTLEAFSYNKPVIISNVDGPKEIFVKKNYAIGFNPKKPEDIIAAVELYIENPNEFQGMVKSAREQIKREFNWGHISEQYKKLYIATANNIAFESDFEPPTEYVPSIEEKKNKNNIKVGLVYDIDIWTMFIHPLEKDGFEVNTYSPEFYKNEQGEIVNVGPIYTTDKDGKKRYDSTATIMRAAPHLERFVAENDVILVCYVGADHWWDFITKTCRKLRKPIIMKYENGLGMEQDNIQTTELKDSLRRATVLAPTDLLSSRILTQIGIPEDRQVIVPNGIDLEKIQRVLGNQSYESATRINKHRFNMPENKVIGAFLGRLDIPKNFYFALKAYQELCEQTTGADKMLILKGHLKDDDLPPLYLSGKHGTLSKNLIADAREFMNKYGGTIVSSKTVSNEGMYGKDTFLLDFQAGMVNQDVYWSYMNACDFVLMPSGWGIGNVRAVGEAMALGKPVIMLDAITHPFAYGEAGIYTKPSHKRSTYEGLPLYIPDIDGFKEVLNRVFTDEKYRKKKAAESYEYVTKYMDMDKIAKERLSPIIKLLADPAVYNADNNTINNSMLRKNGHTSIKNIYKEIAHAMKPTHEIPSGYLRDLKSETKIKQKVNVVLISYNLNHDGNLDYHNEAVYCALSLINLYKDESTFFDNITIHICTNEPDYFDFMKKIPNVKIHNYADSTLKGWEKIVDDPVHNQKYTYFIKVKVLQEIAKKVKESVMFFDTDIVFNHKLTHVFNGLDSNTSFMNEREFKMKTDKAYYMDFVKAFNNHSIVNEETYMWNSGCMGIHKSNLHIIDEILDLMEKFVKTKFSLFDYYLTKFPPAQYGKPYDNHRTVEQLAVGIKLEECSIIRQTWDLYYHYHESKGKFRSVINKYVPELKKLNIHNVLNDNRYNYFFDWIYKGFA